MKAFKNIVILLCLSITTVASAQKADSLGLPGDNFDLPGALELFKKSSTPEEFEKAINKNDNEVNNLDLNGDNEVDYVKVIDNKDGDAHSMVLQVEVAKKEVQDVAVILIEKTKDGNAHIQIVGDEELYGKDYIVEPKEEKTVSTEKIKSDSETDDVYKSKNDNSGFNNNNSSNNTNTVYYNNDPTVYVNVYPWPMVQYIYTPTYVVWTSPWYYGYYPGWYNPWRPIYWRNHYWRAHHYHHHYYHAHFYRSPMVHKGYYGRRMSSETVREHQRSGYYAERQIAYKENVKPGRKYNSLPANSEKKVGKRNGSEENVNQPKKNYGKEENFSNQPKGSGRNVNNDQPKEINSEPRKNTSQPKEIYNSPKNTQQPKYENTQPVKQQPQKHSVKQGGGGKSVGGSLGGGNSGSGRNTGGGNGGGGRNTGGGGGRNHK